MNYKSVLLFRLLDWILYMLKRCAFLCFGRWISYSLWISWISIFRQWIS